MHFVEVEDRVKLYVKDLNPGYEDAVVFIHGWPVNHKMFEYQLNFLPNYNFRCVAIDLRGFGNSDKPWHGYCYNRLADDIRFVIEELNLRNITLVGFSMGGAIAIRYLSRYKKSRVKKLALLSAAAPVFTKREDYPYGKSIEEVNKLILDTYENRPEMVSEFGKIFFNTEVTPNFRTWFNGLGLEGENYSTIKTAVSLRDEDLRNDLKNIDVPTGIFHGKKDKVCPYELALEMKKGIDNSVLYTFENSGHGIFYDELEEFNKKFTEFLLQD